MSTMNQRTTTDRVTSGFAVLDLETTGLSPAKGARAIEVGVVVVEADGGIEDRWETLVNPGCGPGPTHIHGVTHEMLDDAPGFADIVGDLAVRLEGRTIVAHNASFDIGFLDAEFASIGIAWEREPLCTMRLAKRRGHHPANLAFLCDRFGIVNRGAHHALGDAVATAELLRNLEVTPKDLPGIVAFPAGHPDPTGRVHLRPDA